MMASTKANGQILHSPERNCWVGLRSRAGELQSQIGGIVRYDDFVDLDAVNFGSATKRLILVAMMVVPWETLPICFCKDLVSCVPSAHEADSKPHHHLVMIEWNTSESFPNEVSCYILTRQCVDIASMRCWLACWVTGKINTTIAQLIESNLVLGFYLANSATVFLKQVQACRASPAVIFTRTVTSSSITGTIRRTKYGGITCLSSFY